MYICTDIPTVCTKTLYIMVIRVSKTNSKDTLKTFDMIDIFWEVNTKNLIIYCKYMSKTEKIICYY